MIKQKDEVDHVSCYYQSVLPCMKNRIFSAPKVANCQNQHLHHNKTRLLPSVVYDSNTVTVALPEHSGMVHQQPNVWNSV